MRLFTDPIRKVAYKTKEKAKLAARHTGSGLAVYKCYFGGYEHYHVGHGSNAPLSKWQ